VDPSLRAAAPKPCFTRSVGHQPTVCLGVYNPRGIVSAFESYTWTKLRDDLLAGCTVSVVLIPQAIAYGLLAGLPPIYGLYCALTPLLLYSLTTTSIHTCVGPFALVSLLVAQLLKGALGPEVTGAAYIGAMMTLSFMTGVVQLVMGALRAGAVTTFLGDTVVAGFTTGSAILIMSSQVKHLLGISLPREEPVQVLLSLVTGAWQHINPYAVAISVACIASMMWIKDANKKYLPKVIIPEQLIVLMALTALSAFFGLSEVPYNVRCLGSVTATLPAFTPPSFDLALMRKLIEPAILTAVISYMITVSIAQSMASKFKYAIDSNREMFALGAANLLGSFFQAYPAAGSLSRSAVCSVSGCRTQAHGIVQFVAVLATLLWCMPLMASLPYPALAAVVVMALKTMVDFGVGKVLLNMSQGDFVQWIVTLVATVLLGAQMGLAAGLLSSVLWLGWQTSRPSWAVMGRRMHSSELVDYRNVCDFPDSKQLPGILVFRFDGPLHFANKDYFCEVLKDIGEERDVRQNAAESWYRSTGYLPEPQIKVTKLSVKEDLKAAAKAEKLAGVQVDDTTSAVPVLVMVIDASSMLNVDAAGVQVLKDVVQANRAQDPPTTVLLSGVRGDFRRKLSKSGLDKVVGMDNIFVDLHSAVVAAEAHVQSYLEVHPLAIIDSVVI